MVGIEMPGKLKLNRKPKRRQVLLFHRLAQIAVQIRQQRTARHARLSARLPHGFGQSLRAQVVFQRARHRFPQRQLAGERLGGPGHAAGVRPLHLHGRVQRVDARGDTRHRSLHRVHRAALPAASGERQLRGRRALRRRRLRQQRWYPSANAENCAITFRHLVSHPSCLRNRQMLSDTSTTVNPISARKFGQSTSMPLPFINAARAMMPKWRMGFSQVTGCIQAGMASTGVSEPESTASGGLMKNAVIMRLLRRLGERRDESADADAGEDA